ncbi:thioredoxin family protein [Sulfurospirillum sp. 1612]|uniref:thioredoxin family protein n=1 Tax=Sulfurospirillum sp. 1612 TaxID=3094835 RepID=UPI002F93911B
MKKVCLFLSIVASLYAYTATKTAQELHYINSFEQGMALAKKEHKMVMLVVVKDHCPWCKKLEQKTLCDTKIQQKTSQFVKILIDRNQKMPACYHTAIVPVVSFIDPSTQETEWEAYGYRTVDKFLDDIKNAQEDSI